LTPTFTFITETPTPLETVPPPATLTPDGTPYP
jgi:hypothetical protein